MPSQFAPSTALKPSIMTKAIAALTGIVSTHAVRMFPATPHRTAEMRLLAPTPMMQALMQCVVDTGTPKWLAPKIVMAPEVSAAKPWSGVMRMIFDPIVLMIFLPPAIVPSAIAAAHETMTQLGIRLPSGSIHDGSPE